jgi:hypothetical protein
VSAARRESHAPGATVEIDGLGVYENGFEYDISTDEAEAYRNKHTTYVTKVTNKGNTIVDSSRGMTLLEAFKKHKGIDVRKMTDDELKVFTAPDDQLELPLTSDPKGDGS